MSRTFAVGIGRASEIAAQDDAIIWSLLDIEDKNGRERTLLAGERCWLPLTRHGKISRSPKNQRADDGDYPRHWRRKPSIEATICDGAQQNAGNAHSSAIRCQPQLLRTSRPTLASGGSLFDLGRIAAIALQGRRQKLDDFATVEGVVLKRLQRLLRLPVCLRASSRRRLVDCS